VVIDRPSPASPALISARAVMSLHAPVNSSTTDVYTGSGWPPRHGLRDRPDHAIDNDAQLLGRVRLAEAELSARVRRIETHGVTCTKTTLGAGRPSAAERIAQHRDEKSSASQA